MPPDDNMAELSPVRYGDAKLMRKCMWRLLPFLFICYLFAKIDQLNVSFAKLHMLQDLGFSDLVYGIGAGIFFLGYSLFEVPSNLLLKKYGARLWIARIMLTWGIISASMMFVHTPTQFYALRFLLGVAEAGFFPGVIFYLTGFFPRTHRTRVTALFMTALALSGVVAGPISGLILKTMGGMHGLAAWQWLFLLEAAPTIVLGLAVFWYLPASPSEAKWLSTDEKTRLSAIIADDQQEAQAPSLSVLLSTKPVWVLSAIYTLNGISFYGLIFWLPTIIAGSNIKDPFVIGNLSSVPWIVGAVGMVVVSSFVDKSQNHRNVATALCLLTALAWVVCPFYANDLPASIALLSIAITGLLAWMPVFWHLPTSTYQGTAAAVAIATITSVGNLSGFVSPYLVAWSKQMTHSLDSAMYLFAGASVVAAALTMALGGTARRVPQALADSN